ncbi:hypothetical protein ACFWU5_13080 [Nocardia sp. NPDC058640]|uniref:hypothetical protein n=1 Tax=Nocardia sp. NPDC058640 TaxID=3346571 RepID=UPI00364EED66
MAELDDIGSETASMMRTMLQMATLVALKSREHGQKEAETRAKAIEAKMKEARELQIREARDLKAKDPRNMELVQMMSVGSRSIEARSIESRGVESRGISLSKKGSPFASTAAGQSSSVGHTASYDSSERRAAIAAHLQRAGVAPDLAEVRMLMEIGQGIDPADAIRRTNAATREFGIERGIEARGIQRGVERGIERGR